MHILTPGLKSSNFAVSLHAGMIIVISQVVFEECTMSAKIEVLTDRIGVSRKAPDPLRAVRHFDAARKKLEKLQVWRRELKEELAQCIGERDAAVCEIGRLNNERDAQLAKLERIAEQLNAQEAVIAELRDARAHLLEKYEPVAPSGLTTMAEPALTVRVLEKVDSDVADRVDETLRVDVTTGDGRQLFGWVKRLLPRAHP